MSERRSKKRDAILGAAKALFCAEGYSGTSVDAIAARAGVSKATVYAHFPSKNDLFTQVLSTVAESYIRLTDELLDLPVEEGMRQLAHRFLDLVTTPEALTIYRTVFSQGPQFPEMVEAFKNGGPRRVIGAVSRYLRLQTERGILKVPDPDLTAVLFLHAVKGDVHAQALAGLPICGTDRDRAIDEVVRMMLAAYAP